MTKRRTLQDKAMLALRKAVRGVIERHRKENRPLAVWKNGKVVHISASKISRRK